jgi:hypothetical protein
MSLRIIQHWHYSSYPQLDDQLGVSPGTSHTGIDDLGSFLWVLSYSVLEIIQSRGTLPRTEISWSTRMESRNLAIQLGRLAFGRLASWMEARIRWKTTRLLPSSRRFLKFSWPGASLHDRAKKASYEALVGTPPMTSCSMERSSWMRSTSRMDSSILRSCLQHGMTSYRLRHKLSMFEFLLSRLRPKSPHLPSLYCT